MKNDISEESAIITNYLNEIIYVLDSTARITYISSNIEKITGFTHSEILGRSFTEFVYPSDVAGRNEAFTKALSGYDKPSEYRMVKKNGEVIWLRTNARPIYRNGEIEGVQGVLTDITDLIEKEQELTAAKTTAEAKENNMRCLNLLVSKMLSMPDLKSLYGFITHILRRRYPGSFVLYVSVDEKRGFSRLENTSGIDDTLMVKIIKHAGFNPMGKKYKLVPTHNRIFRSGKFTKFDDGLAGFSSSEFPKVAAYIIENLTGISNIYTIGINSDDSLLAAVHIFTTKGRIITDTNFIDTFIKQAGLVIEKKMTEAELIKAKEEAIESDMLKTAFLQNISHEVRTPLNAIVGFSRLLADSGNTPEQIKEFTDMLSTSSDKLIEVITDVVELSKIQTNQISLSISEFDVIELTEEIVTGYLDRAAEKGITLRLTQNIAVPCRLIITDRNRLKRILSHITENAIKFTHSGTVKMTLSADNGMIKFVIRDTGIGISLEKQQVIFKPFTQVEHELTKKYSGAGLGLAISRGYCNLLKGNMTLRSEPNRGTTVTISIPLDIHEQTVITNHAANFFRHNDN